VSDMSFNAELLLNCGAKQKWEIACILWRNMRNALQLLVGLDLAGDRTLALLLAIDCD
jgi:hypothetical protein